MAGFRDFGIVTQIAPLAEKIPHVLNLNVLQQLAVLHCWRHPRKLALVQALRHAFQEVFRIRS